MRMVCCICGTCRAVDWVWQDFGKVREAMGAPDLVLLHFGALQWELVGEKGKVVHPGFEGKKNLPAPTAGCPGGFQGCLGMRILP